jgi:uncharacterized membrane protein
MTMYSMESTRVGCRWFLRTEIDRLLTASMCFSCGLVVLRMIHAHSLLFVFMIWNLFLAYVPYALSNWLSRRLDRTPLDRPLTTPSLSLPITRRPLFLMAVCLVWLLFVPNAFYMLTDLYHLSDNRSPRIPEWYDLALIFSFAWNGLLLGVLSVRQMERLLESRRLASGIFGRRRRVPLRFPGGVFVYPVIGLCALGVYTGRYLRYNSWDILSYPFQLIGDMAGMIIHPLHNQPAWSMILCYTILLSFIYTMLKKISRALN